MSTEYDAIIIGAGFAGIYAAHKLRDDLGLNVLGLDAAGGVGGTWWWNRYPGARCDIESIHYAYSFSEEIQREWRWSERYAAQPEILNYLEFVADKLDVRSAFRFGTRVTSMVWDDARKRWDIGTDAGARLSARFVIAGTGNVTVPKSRAEFPGIDSFRGDVYVTSNWPHDGVNLAGKRVGIIGTGSTAIQLVPQLARQAAHLTVFQRTPNYAVPLRNESVDVERQKLNAENSLELRAKSRVRFMGVPYENPAASALDVSPAERRARYDALWQKGGFHLLLSSYGDLLTDARANETAAEYVREHIRARVSDPKLADALCPTDYPYATKRPALEDDYYDTFNRDNVTLVDLRAAPLETITPHGIVTGGQAHALDVIVLATGFDAVTGALMQMGIVGRNGVPLSEHWAHGPQTYLGIASAGFPNLFFITGPTSATALYNMPLAIEDHVDFSAAAIQFVLAQGASTIEADADAEQAWYKLVRDTLEQTLFPRANSWYMGANVPGKPRSPYIFAGSAPLYREICADVVDHGYAGFRIGDAEAGRVPPMVRIDAGVAKVIGAMLMEEVKPLEECTLDEMREAVEDFKDLQKPAPTSVQRVEETYPAPAGNRRAYVYRPKKATGSLPIIIYVHGGGFVAGSIDMCIGVCGGLAEDLQAVVVTPSYRLAPEAQFPAASDDIYAALCWTAQEAVRLGGDPDRIVIMGESAGGLLAAVTAQRARDEQGPAVWAQVLLYPTIDAEAQTASRIEFAKGPLVSAAAASGMWAAYLGDLKLAASPLASPGRAKSLSGLPPALVVTAECDPMRDEGEDYGHALQAAGVPTQIHRLEGLVHAVFYMSRYVPRAAEITDKIAGFLQTLPSDVRMADRVVG